MTSPLPTALVLTAGLGTRLWPLTARRAKPAVPLAGATLIERILAGLARQGVPEAVLNLHHLPATVTGVVGDGAGLGLRVRYSLEPVVLGSAGGPRRALPLIGSDPFLLVNGDTLIEVDLRDLLAAHTRTGALVTMAVVPLPCPGKYGGVVLGNDDVVERFTPRDSAEQAWHFVGVQVVAAEVFAALADGEACDSVRDVYRPLISARPGAVRAYRTSGEFIDVGTPADYLEASLRLAARDGAVSSLVAAEDPASGTAISDSVVWDGARLGDGVRLRRCIVADGCELPPGCLAEDAVLVPAAGLSPRAIDRVVGTLLVAPLAPDGARRPFIEFPS